MTTKEFSDQFDVLYNNITSNLAPGLNEYEKSVFLTKAQDEIVKNHFEPDGNPLKKGFDDSLKRLADFSMIMNTAEGILSLGSYGSSPGKVDPRAYHYKLPEGIMYIINESVQFYKGELENSDNEASMPAAGSVAGIRQVIPLTYDEYTRNMEKPFKEPAKYQAWRLITNKSSDVPEVDIIITSSDKAKFLTNEVPDRMKYIIRYVKRPCPIVLEDLDSAFGEDLSIHGVSKKSQCELDPVIHEEILQRAVELAKVAWAGNQEQIASTQLNISSGLRSE